MEIGLDEDDEVTDIREQMFHNTVREQIVSSSSDHSTIIIIIMHSVTLRYEKKTEHYSEFQLKILWSVFLAETIRRGVFFYSQRVCVCLWLK